MAPLGITYQGATSSLSSVSGTSATNPTPSVNITEFIANGGFYGLNTINNNEISTIVNKFKSAGITQLEGIVQGLLHESNPHRFTTPEEVPSDRLPAIIHPNGGYMPPLWYPVYSRYTS